MVWAPGQLSIVQLETPEAVIEQIAYAMANPVKAGLIYRSSALSAPPWVLGHFFAWGRGRNGAARKVPAPPRMRGALRMRRGVTWAFACLVVGCVVEARGCRPSPRPNRIEISAVFSGSAYRYHSFLTGSLSSAIEWIEAEARDEQGGAMLVTEGFDVVIELLEDGADVLRRSLLPAPRIASGDLTITFGADGTPALDGVSLDDDSLQDRLDEIVDAFVEEVVVTSRSTGSTCASLEASQTRVYFS